MIWNKLDLNLYLKTFSVNTIIYHQQQDSEFVYIIKKGRVRLSIYSKEGNEKCLTIAEEGCMFGELSILDGLPNFATARTIVNCEIFLIPKDTFTEVFMYNPEVSKKVIQSLVRKIRTLSSQIEDLSFKNSYSRVASYLIRLAHVHAAVIGKTFRLNIKFTHQEMADLTGLSRVTVSNIMSDLVSSKCISKVNGFIIINDIDKLYELI